MTELKFHVPGCVSGQSEYNKDRTWSAPCSGEFAGGSIAMYDSDTAAESENVNQPYYDRQTYTIQNARKSRTVFFNALNADNFNYVINPVVIEPVVQFTLYLKVIADCECDKPGARASLPALSAKARSKDVPVGTLAGKDARAPGKERFHSFAYRYRYEMEPPKPETKRRRGKRN